MSTHSLSPLGVYLVNTHTHTVALLCSELEEELFINCKMANYPKVKFMVLSNANLQAHIDNPVLGRWGCDPSHTKYNNDWLC